MRSEYLDYEARLPDGDLQQAIFMRDIDVQVRVNRAGRVTHATAKAREWMFGPDTDSVRARVETLARTWRYRPFIRGRRRVEAAFTQTIYAFPRSPRVSESFPEIRDLSSLRIRLRRTPCFGLCPAYSIDIRGDGSVEFMGESNIVVLGVHRSTIGQAAIIDLVARLRKARYFALRSWYRGAMNDIPSTITAVEYDGHQKFVVDMAGERAGMPRVVREIEEAIDRASGAARWVNGNEETIASLVAEGWDPRSPEAATLLMRAAGNRDLVLALVRAGAPLHKSDVGGVIGGYAARGDLDAVRVFVEAGAFEGGTGAAVAGIALRRAAASGYVESVAVVRPYVRRREDLSAALIDAVNAAPLVLSPRLEFRHDPAEIVRALVAEGADVNAGDEEGKTPIFHVRDPGLARLLVELGADLNHRDAEGKTPLHRAIFPDLQAVLLAAGARTDAEDEEGETPLFHAMHASDAEIVAALLRRGADPNNRNRAGRTPLFYAHSDETAKLLLAAGADPNAEDQHGDTPLFWLSNEKVTRVLIAHGADAAHRNRYGESALFGLISEEAALVLMAAGVDTSERSRDGQTLAERAEEYGWWRILERLDRKSAR
jgi:ankyrin repeat protein